MSKNSSRTGYVKDWRQELDSDIWLMPPLYQRVWQWLKYQVNHVENEIPMADGSKFKIMPGQHLTSYRNIAKGIGWMEGRAWKEPNPKTIKKILEWLEKNLMITQSHGRGNREYTLITLTKWEVYQAELNSSNAKVTRKKQLVEQGVVQGVDINNNDKEIIKNNNKEVYRFTPPTLELVQSYITENQYTVDAERFINFYESKGWMVGKNKMKDWKAAVRTWAKDKPKQTKQVGRVEQLSDYSVKVQKPLTPEEELRIKQELEKIGQ